MEQLADVLKGIADEIGNVQTQLLFGGLEGLPEPKGASHVVIAHALLQQAEAHLELAIQAENA